MQYIGIIAGNPTADETDGWEVSSGGLYTSPLSATVERNQTKVVKCAVRCQLGYTCASASLVTTAAWLKLSTDQENWASTLTLTDIDDTNKIFYAQITGGADAGTTNGTINLSGQVNPL